MGLTTDLFSGSATGILATVAMGRATTVFYERQSASSRLREDQLREEQPTTALVKRAAEAAGSKLDDEQAERLGALVHYGMGGLAGSIAVLLRRRGMGAMGAGVAAALAMWVAVDEGANYVLGLAAPATAWPLATHARGLVGHLVLGLTTGLGLAITRTGRRVA